MPTNAPTRKHPCLCCLILAFFCALLSFLPLLLQDGGKLLFMSDYLEQQIPFGMYINESIKSGQVYWSWGMDLGTNFIGAFSFYLLGSPFFWLSMPFPSSWYIYIAGIIYILKYMVAALTAFLWLRRQVNGENAALFGALLYAFSGFQSLNLIFSHFHDVAALFPLLLLAVDLWVQEGRRWPLALAACINLLTNYVFFVGEVVFLAVYYLVRWLIPDVRRGGAPPAGLYGSGRAWRGHGGCAVCAVGAVSAQQSAHPAAWCLTAVFKRRIAVSGAQYAASGL